MEIKDMRKMIGITQREFAELYHLPLQTLKQWEASPDSTAHRRPPDYVKHLLERLIQADFGISFGPLSRADNLVTAAQHSKGNARQWLRYLRKEFQGHELLLLDEQIQSVLSRSELSMIQKVIFKRATEKGTATNIYVTSLNDKAQTPMVDDLIRRSSNGL